ncbi:hypothetical protein J6590_085853 [Homalodisca vitripennis]|nr:hypothetical protein J6590_085853 [Homalodisca vitripennis]
MRVSNFKYFLFGTLEISVQLVGALPFLQGDSDLLFVMEVKIKTPFQLHRNDKDIGDKQVLKLYNVWLKLAAVYWMNNNKDIEGKNVLKLCIVWLKLAAVYWMKNNKDIEDKQVLKLCIAWLKLARVYWMNNNKSPSPFENFNLLPALESVIELGGLPDKSRNSSTLKNTFNNIKRFYRVFDALGVVAFSIELGNLLLEYLPAKTSHTIHLYHPLH